MHDATLATVLVKFPRTPHLEGSRLQPGDEDLAQVAFDDIRGQHLIVEEKLDGANAGISFGRDGDLRLQSRGHFLSGGPREKQFALLKSWAMTIAPRLWPVLRDRYILYGEWLYAKHTVFYDALPHYFHEFDVYDREHHRFLTNDERAMMRDGLPIVTVPVLYRGQFDTLADLTALITASTVRTPLWRESLARAAQDAGLDPDRVAAETDKSDQMEGLYLKVEDAEVRGRYKWVRPSFLTAILDSGTHWSQRPIVVNRLADPGAMYANL
jgi:hypothetical protein